jgi:hypothetical protein
MAEERHVIEVHTAQEFQQQMESASQTAAQAAAGAVAQAVGAALANVADHIERSATISTNSAEARAGAEAAVKHIVAELRRVAREFQS